MANSNYTNLKLGFFVLAGLALLIAGFYLIGKDTNLFSKNYTLRARFADVQGLSVGNNVRYAGIQVGTVKNIAILSDTVVEISMIIDQKMKAFIHKNDLATLGTDGLMGNKLINILPGKTGGPLAADNDMLGTYYKVSMDDMLETLSFTNKNLAQISQNLLTTVQRINQSEALWAVLNDPELPRDLRASLKNITKATGQANALVSEVYGIVADVKQGKGAAGLLLTDTSFGSSLSQAVEGIKTLEAKAADLADQLTALTLTITKELKQGNGTAGTLLQDTAMARNLQKTITHLETGTQAFSENMEALKHNFLFRGYFRKKEKQEAGKNDNN